MLTRVLIFAFSLGPCAVSIIYSLLISHCKDDAPRGGAVGTAVALIFALLYSGFGMKTFQQLQIFLNERKGRADETKTTSPSPRTIEDLASELSILSNKVNSLVDAIAADGNDRSNLNVCLAVTTFISTIVWGFADIVAAHFIIHSQCNLPKN